MDHTSRTSFSHKSFRASDQPQRAVVRWCFKPTNHQHCLQRGGLAAIYWPALRAPSLSFALSLTVALVGQGDVKGLVSARRLLIRHPQQSPRCLFSSALVCCFKLLGGYASPGKLVPDIAGMEGGLREIARALRGKCPWNWSCLG